MNDRKKMIVNQPAQHAFVMAGAKTIFLCHLTMLKKLLEHMYQVVLRVRLPYFAMQEYLADRERHQGETYFLGNVADDLMTNPDLNTGARVSFIGNIWRGIPDKPVYSEWPWKDVDPIIANVPVTVERVVYYRHFDHNFQFPKSLTYVLFGSGQEAHLYHYQTTEPDFDQVVTLKEAPTWLSGRLLEAGVNINMPTLSSRPVRCSNPLTEFTYQVHYCGLEMEQYEIKIDRSLWFSTKIANSTDPCA